MKKDNSAKSLPVKASKYPTKRTVNLAQRESHSRSTLTLTLGLVLIVVLSFCVANFGVLRQLDRQRAAENAYNTVHSQYVQMQQALADYDDVELQYRTYSRTWMQEEDSPFYIPVDRLEVLDPPAGETEVGDEGYMEFHVDEAALRQTVIDLFYEPRQAS